MMLAVLAGLCSAVEPPKPFGPVPSERQLAWHELEMYGFLHFGPNTFAGREWGFGDDKPDIFQPTAFDADQIVKAVKDGGLKGLILTAKHHDGYCLWPSKFTEHSVKNSPWKNGKGDVVKEISEACKRQGMKFGVYISPWDRNYAEYGRTGYVEYYKNTITELLSNYGPIFEMWFDGACGGDGWYGGQKGQRGVDYNTYYPWKSIREIIRKLQPDCAIWCAQYKDGDRTVFADCIWGGSEGGDVGDPRWNALESNRTNHGMDDWRSGNRNGDVWCPAEGDVSIRPGWFYHADQDNSVKTPGQLMDIYFSCIGRGGNLILNIPPDQRGLIHDNDVKALKGFHTLMEQTFGTDLAKPAKVTASNVRGNDKTYAPQNLTDGKRETYWATDDDVMTPEAVLEFDRPVTFNVVRLREYLPLGQRVDDWALDVLENGGWKEFAKGSAIGNCRLVRSKEMITTDKVRLRIAKAAACPALSEFALFAEPVKLALPTIRRDQMGLVTLAAAGGSADLRYTVDGSEPALGSAGYTQPFPLETSGTVKARTVSVKDGTMSEVASATFDMAKGKWKVVAVSNDASGLNGVGAIDDNPSSLWQTHPLDGERPPPQEIVVDMGEEVEVQGFTYLPRQDSCFHGMTDKYQFYLGADGKTWGQPAAEGEFGNLRANPIKQTVNLPAVTKARYFKFVGTHCLERNHIVVAELGMIGRYVGTLTGGQASDPLSMPLRGTWRVVLNQSPTGAQPVEILLPGSLDERGVSPKVDDKSMDRLSRDHQYVGKAVYTRDIEIPANWSNKYIHLVFERCMWKTTLTVDGNLIGSQESLCTPHRFELGQLAPGKHHLQVEVDNSAIYNVGGWSHGYSEQIQTLWNGLVGKMELTATGSSWIDEVQVYPNLTNKSARVVVTLKNGSASPVPGKNMLHWDLATVGDSGEPASIQTGQSVMEGPPPEGKIEFQIDLSKNFRAWDEFSPHLYQLTLKLVTPEAENIPYTVQFGMREFGTKEGQFTINGRPTFLRGNHDGGNFPLTGYPSCDVRDWLRIMKIVKAHGLNHLRFHSWTPPEAAFIAADQTGVYLHTELPLFSLGSGPLQPMQAHSREEFLRAELDRILKAYGNHPSFCLLAMGNELSGDYSLLDEWTQHARNTDPRHLFSDTANPEANGTTLAQKWDQFLVEHSWYDKKGGRHERRGNGNGETITDFAESLEGLTVPIMSHEVGQAYVYPNYDEIGKYTGLLQPWNFKAYRDHAKEHGTLEQNHALALASAKLAVTLYKDEIERQLRTPRYGGFQLLDLHDYPGQGTALVGLLDAFWDSKGAVTPEEFSHFCGSVVPLARLPKMVWKNNETLKAQIDLAQYGPTNLNGLTTTVRLIEKSGALVAETKLPSQNVATGTLAKLGQVEFSLAKVTQPRELLLKVSIPRDGIENNWRIWVYPATATPKPGSVLVTSSWADALKSLQAGGAVLWLAANEPGGHPLRFGLPFWAPSWNSFANRNCGLLIDAKHPGFNQFPTDFFSDWQWHSLSQGGSIMNLDELPRTLKPLVQVIDSPLFNWRLAALIEGKVGSGKLMVCTLNVDSNNSDPVSNQFLASLLDYMNSVQFNPAIALSEHLPEQLFSIDGGLAKSLGAKVLREPGMAQEGVDLRMIALGSNAPKPAVANGAANLLEPGTGNVVFSQPSGPPYEIVFGFPTDQSFNSCCLVATEYNGKFNPANTVKDFALSASSDGTVWSEPFKGSFAADQPFNRFQFGTAQVGKYFKLVLLNSQNSGRDVALGRFDLRSAAER